MLSIGLLQHCCVASDVNCRVHVELCTIEYCIFVGTIPFSVTAYCNVFQHIIMLILHRPFLRFVWLMSANTICCSMNCRLLEWTDDGFFISVCRLTIEYWIAVIYVRIFLEQMPPDFILDQLDLFFQRFPLMRFLHNR